MTRAEHEAAALLALQAATLGDVELACRRLELAAPRFTWRTSADRWAIVETARAVRTLVAE